MIRVVSWGIAGSLVDGGRTGRAWLGQSRGGAVDLASLGLANRLVGNVETLAGLESAGGLRLAFEEPTMVALTGAVAEVSVAGGPAVGWGAPVVLPAGSSLRIGRLLDGARVYVAVRGGAQSTADGLIVGADPLTSAASQPAARTPLTSVVRLWPGPRLDWAAAETWAQLLSGEFPVTATSRVGVRLGGAALQRTNLAELPSEGMVEGAVQLPPDGHPIIMLADHPTTGGYPVIAVVDPAALPAVAQAAIGTSLRFSR
ncbi:MAG: biotin-dependent carboxyltransferase family protein [Ilumatobacteraceae bacterium]